LKSALNWLLEDEQPSIRYLALTGLLGRAEQDEDVRAARKSVGTRGWASEILAKQSPDGAWAGRARLYAPKYLSTNWMLLVLADLGLRRDDPRISKACDLWIRAFSKEDGGFGADGTSRSHLCIVGNTARALVKFGYSEHPKVRSALEWMVKNSAEKGGWSCYGSGRNLDSWEPMSAFAAYPKQKWTKGMKQAVEKGAEFYLEREMFRQGDHYEPWYRTHYPVHYYYDMLVGLDFMTELGFGDDARLKKSIEWLKEKRRPDGRWNLDAVHPDVEGGMAEWYNDHPRHRPAPFALERAGEPSRMITVIAMRVLQRVDDRT